MKTYIYVKTHRVTGLKYLGKTQQDPYKYQGSGVYWTNHIKKHGYDVDTEILCECETAEEVKERGLYYSELWNVVESNEWANLTEETGAGFSSRQSKKLWEDEEYRKMHSEMNSERLKKQWENEEYRKMKSEQSKKLWENEEYRKTKSEQSKKQWENQELRKMKSEQAKKRWENQELRKMKSEQAKKQLEDPKNHPSYDHTIYSFVHESGIKEYCTRHELQTKYSLNRSNLSKIVKGVQKSYRGWRILSKK